LEVAVLIPPVRGTPTSDMLRPFSRRAHPLRLLRTRIRGIPMLRSLTHCLCIVAFSVASNIAIAQTEFSADVVTTKQSGSSVEMKLYLGKDKMRIESMDKARENQGVGILNLSTQTMIVLMKQQQKYMEM